MEPIVIFGFDMETDIGSWRQLACRQWCVKIISYW